MKINRLFILVIISFSFVSCSLNNNNLILPNDPNFQFEGRIDKAQPNSYRFSQPGISIKFKFEGKKCTIKLKNESDKNLSNYYNLLIDENEPRAIAISNSDANYIIELQDDKPHTITIFKRTENFVGVGIFEGVLLEKGKKLLPVELKKHKMEFIGNSITCGYGNEGSSRECPFSPETENNYLAYSATTARNLNAEFYAIAYSGIGMIQNYDLENKQTMPYVYDRILADFPDSKWNFKNYTPDVVVLNLGTNDFAHSNPDSTFFINTYLTFVQKIRKNYPNAQIFCLEGCMLNDYSTDNRKPKSTLRNHIETIVKKLNSEGDNLVYSYFFSGMQEDEFGCDWHPNVKKHQSMSKDLTGFIKSKTGW
jgi:lysophospholipase L1-like esterase